MNYLSAVTKGMVASLTIVCALTACGGSKSIPPSTQGRLVQCDVKTESFAVYPAGSVLSVVTGVPDGNFKIVVGRAPANARVVLYAANGSYLSTDAIQGTTFAPLSGPVPSPSNPLPPDASNADLSQSVVPALKPKTTYFWTLSNASNPTGCHAFGYFTTL